MQLTAIQYNTLYQNLLRKFATEQTKAFNEKVYKITTGHSPAKLINLFLFCYALSTWENTADSYNYLTEKQMLSIIEKAR